MTTEAKTRERAAATRNRLKGDVQRTSIIGLNHGKLGTWFRGRWGARVSFTQWQLMPPWRRLTCHILPVLSAVLVGYCIVQTIGNRYEPRIVVSHAVVPAIVKPGQVAEQLVTARDERECHGMTRRWIVDSGGVIYDLMPIPVFQHVPDADPNTPFTFVHEFQVPYGITPGDATIHTHTDRWCNFFQKHLWPIHADYIESFKVVGEPEIRPPVRP